MNGAQTRQRPVAGERTGRCGSRYSDGVGDDIARAPRESNAPGLLVRLSDPPRVYILADDLDQELAAREVARALAQLLERIEWREAGA